MTSGGGRGASPDGRSPEGAADGGEGAPDGNAVRCETATFANLCLHARCIRTVDAVQAGVRSKTTFLKKARGCRAIA